MTASSRAMAFMSAMLAMGNGATLPFNLRGVSGATPFRPSKHRNNRTTRLAGRRSRCKLQTAHGPGTISAKADIQQLCQQGKYLEAREFVELHERQCREVLFPNAWWRSEETPADNA